MVLAHFALQGHWSWANPQKKCIVLFEFRNAMWFPELESLQDWGWAGPGRQVWGRDPGMCCGQGEKSSCHVKDKCVQSVVRWHLPSLMKWQCRFEVWRGTCKGWWHMYALAGGFYWGLGFRQLQSRDLTIHLCPRVWQQADLEEGKGGRRGLASTPGGLQLGLSLLGNCGKTQISELKPALLHGPQVM